MSKQFFGGLSAGPQWPDLIMNEGPLPKAAAGQFSGIPDGEINERVSGLLNDVHPYVYGQAARMATQTQLAHPHRVQMAIPVLCVPAPKAEAGCTGDPKLEHVFCDGDLAFTVNMPQDMLHATSQYCLLPFGVGDAYAPLINLATVNYLLWGLQVGRLQPNGARWERYFTHLCRGQYKPSAGSDNYAKEDIFYFLQTFIRPFGVMHGSEKQGGQHEGKRSAVIYPVDYVSSFAVQGKLLKVNNLWRNHHAASGCHLVLELAETRVDQPIIDFDLSCCCRRTERVQVGVKRFFYLKPSVSVHKTITREPHIFIGMCMQSQSAYETSAYEEVQWNCLACTKGLPLEMIFAPRFVESDAMVLAKHAVPEEVVPDAPPPAAVAVSDAAFPAAVAATHAFTGKQMPQATQTSASAVPKRPAADQAPHTGEAFKKAKPAAAAADKT